MKPTISDETLFAYVDGELDAVTRAQVEAAIAADPALAQRVDEQRALRLLLGAAYAPVLEEPVPERLLAATQPRSTGGAKVLELATHPALRSTEPRASTSWGWAQWGGMAACLALGVFIGRSALPGDELATAPDGNIVARGALAHALSVQLASAQPADAPVKIGVSYLSRANEYCRSFTLARTSASGLACRHGDKWQLRMLAQDRGASGQSGGLRMASSATPPAVLRAIDEQIQGSPLDAEAEKAAARGGWRR